MFRITIPALLAACLGLMALPGAAEEVPVEWPVPGWAKDLVSFPQRSEARRLGIPVAYEHAATGIRLVLVPRGTFLMGSPASEAGRSPDEGPQRRVRVEPFYLSIAELTNAQVRRLDAAHRSPPLFDGECQPAVNLDHPRATALASLLSKGVPGPKHRLPSEAEWEYACRAGSVTRFHYGQDEQRLGDHAWHAGNSGRLSHFVGTRKPNAWGLFDMHGNVLEWCADAYVEGYAGAPSDGRPRLPLPSEAARAPRVARGGSWFSPAPTHRSAARTTLAPGARHGNLGMRVARSVSEE